MAKTIVITGASDGIGAAAARQLHTAGHRVVVVGRSPKKTQAVARPLDLDCHVADFTSLTEVRDLADRLLEAYPRIDVLANNAGGVFGDPARTEDGFEKTFQINHLAPFLLTTSLMPRLLESRAAVIQTTTLRGGMVRKLDLDDLNLDNGSNPIHAYNAAKFENVLFTKELHRRYHDQGLSSAAFYPGNVRTNFGAETTSRLMKFIATSRLTRAMLLTTPDKGADTLSWLADTAPGLVWPSGEFFVERKIGTNLNPLTDDAGLAHGLWERSEELLGQ